MKRMLGLLLAVLALGALAVGCSSNEKPSDDSDGIELDFPSWQATEPGFQEFWESAVQQFEEDHPGVTINFYEVPFSGYTDTLITRFGSNNPPDICHLPAADFYAFQREGWFECLDDWFAETDILASCTPLQSAMQNEDGENYGWLVMGYGQLLFYNEKLLEEGNVPVPTNMDELMDGIRKLTKDIDGDGLIDQFGYASASTTTPSLATTIAPFIIGNGTHWATGTQINVDDPKVIEGLETYKALYEENLMPLGLTIEQSRTYFLEGKAAFYMDGSYFAAQLASASEGVREHLKFTETPTERLVGTPSNGLHIPSAISDERKELVWDFIEMLSTDEFQAKYATLTKNPPSKLSALTEELKKEVPEVAFFAEVASKATDMRPAAFVPHNTEFVKLMVDEVMAYVMDPDMSAEQMLTNLEKSIEQNMVLD